MQLLGTLEVLSQSSGCQPFFWEIKTQGEFNLWNLMVSEGFVSLTDPELAFEHWQNIEHWGTPTNPLDYEYAPPRSKRDDETWSDTIATKRQEYYQQLQQLLATNLQSLQAYNLSVLNFSRHSFEWSHPNFSVSIVVGETREHHWLCIAPTVPDELGGFHRRNPAQLSMIAALSCEPSIDNTQTRQYQFKPNFGRTSQQRL